WADGPNKRGRSPGAGRRSAGPNPKGGLENARRITHAVVAVAPYEPRQPGQRALLPGQAVVQRGGKADVGATAAGVTTFLERRHDGGAVHVNVRLDFCHVLTARIVERVGADFDCALGPSECSAKRNQGDNERSEPEFAEERSHRALRCSTEAEAASTKLRREPLTAP